MFNGEKRAIIITIGVVFGVAIPIILPAVLYLLIVDRLRRRKRKQFDDWVKEVPHE